MSADSPEEASADRPTSLEIKVALALFLIAAAVYGGFAFKRVLKQSPDPHFVYFAATANSMIASALGSDEASSRREGRMPFELEKKPPHRNDWASYWEITLADGQVVNGNFSGGKRTGQFKLLDGNAMVLDAKTLRGSKRKQRYFVSFPPGPGFLMMPFVAVFGYEFNDVVFTIAFAAFNVSLMFLLLCLLARRGRTSRSVSENAWLTILFGFGTAHFWCSVMGQVWFTALVMGCTFTLLFLLALFSKRPFLAGIFAAIAFATRTPLLFATVLFYLTVFFPEGKLRRGEWGEAVKEIAWFSAPCLFVGVGLLTMNQLRFDSLTEFGHSYLANGGLGRIKTYGLFNIQFLSKNLTAMFTLLPRFQPDAPYIVVSKHGMSLLLTTPVFLYLLKPKPRTTSLEKFWYRAMWVTVLVIAIPHLLYQNTGYEQFGYRFSLDYTPYLIVLLAVGGHPITRWFKLGILWAVVVNAFGAVTFKRFGKFFTNQFFP